MTTNDDLPHVDLNALVRPVATVKLGEETYDVLPVQGDAMALFEEIVREAKDQRGRPEPSLEEKQQEVFRELDRARRIVHAIAPAIPKERVKTMTVQQLTAIAELSMNAVRKVQALREQAAGKGGGPAGKRTRTRSGRR